MEETVLQVSSVSQEKKPEVFISDLSSDEVAVSLFFWLRTDLHRLLEAFDEIVVKIRENLGLSGVISEVRSYDSFRHRNFL